MGAPNEIKFEEIAKEQVRKYRKKPVVIEALKYDGTNAEAIRTFVLEGCTDCRVSGDDVIITTLEGDEKVSVGDYVIKGIHGECYPCKPDIFMATYEEVKEEN